MKVTNILKTSVMTLLMASTCLIASTVQAQVKSATAEEKATAKALVGFIRAKTDMTPSEQEEMWKKFEGKKVVFKGTVRTVGTSVAGKFYVSLTVGRIGWFENLNIQFNVPRHLRGTVAMWDIGETHVMRGIISGRGDLKDDAVCSDAEIVE